MAIFEKVSKYADADIAMPVRKTAQSAGYDFVAAEDYIIPSIFNLAAEATERISIEDDEYMTLKQMILHMLDILLEKIIVIFRQLF